jgi:CHASE3 domain sensor protein
MKTIREIAITAGTVAALALLGLSAYLAVNSLMRMQKNAGLTRESSLIHSGISNVQKDLTDMETGQRGYLLTANDSYLQPYADGKARIAGDFAELRRGLSLRTEQQRSLELQVESLADSKQAEMERSINLRQRGFRRRAFRLVDSNEGMGYMEKARNLLASLSESESTNSMALGSERNAILKNALGEIVVANLCLFMVAGCLFGLTRNQRQRLERDAAQSREQLALRDLQLERLTSVLSNQARSKTSAIEANARVLLQNYGGFLPRQGQECAEQIKEASVQMERLRQDLVGGAVIEEDEETEKALHAVA